MPPPQRRFEQRFVDLEEAERYRKIRRKGHTETKTFIVGGSITTSLYIPPFCVGIDVDGDTPEWKVIWGFRAVVRVGACQINWMLNDVAVVGGTNHLATSTPGSDDRVLDTPLEIHDGDWLRPLIWTADSGTLDLAASVVMVTAAA